MPPPDDTTNDGRARRRLLVSGVVQGVGFRVATLRRARTLGVAGWVRNTADGRVECVAEGAAAAVDELVDFLRVGPPGSAVRDVAASAEEPTGADGFEILADRGPA